MTLLHMMYVLIAVVLSPLAMLVILYAACLLALTFGMAFGVLTRIFLWLVTFR